MTNFPGLLWKPRASMPCSAAAEASGVWCWAAQSCVRETRRRGSEPRCWADRKEQILVTVPCTDSGETLWLQGSLLVVSVGPGSRLSLRLLPFCISCFPKVMRGCKGKSSQTLLVSAGTDCRESNYLLVLSERVHSNDRSSSSWLRVQSHLNQNFVLFWLRNTAFSSEQFPWDQIQAAHYKHQDARAQ